MQNSAISKYLVVTAFVSGTIVMVIELIGSRVIGPPFGVSLFVWTSLITVTLVSLAVGYWLGGRLSDANASHTALFVIILAAGLCLAIVPLIKSAVIDFSLSFGLRAGSLASSTVLFAPPLLLLGMVTPYVVKLYITDTSFGIGKTVGWLYSVSTAGSFVGTVLTGFVLIPNIGVNKIIYLSSLVLVASAVVYFAWFKRRLVAIILVLAPVVPSFYTPGLPAFNRPDGTSVELVEKEDTAYGQIKVVDYSYGREHLREFLSDSIIQGGIDVNTGLSIASYTYYIERLSRAYNKTAKNALVVGLGAGLIPSNLQKYYGIKTDVVEISPSVVKTAEKYFAFDGSKVKVHVQDGRYFLKTSSDIYDIIVLDAFSGDITPGHLMSVEAFSLIKKRLATGGVLLINFIGGNMPDDKFVLTSLYGTLSPVFKNIDVYSQDNYFAKEPSVVNIVFVAHDAAVLDEAALMPGWSAQPVHTPLRADIDGIYKRKVAVEKGPIIFTDDYNPADFFDMRLRERFRALTLNSADKAVIVN
ncbi:hypothetical protein EPN18_04375 [bacterium]|nr:MAG: hypothetical protein EPN18_04375 [bacterium]